MRIVSFRHKDLERFWRHNEARGAARQYEDKLRAMLTALEEAENVSELATVPGWRLHALKGNRKGAWSLRITHNYPADIQRSARHGQRSQLRGISLRKVAVALKNPSHPREAFYLGG